MSCHMFAKKIWKARGLKLDLVSRGQKIFGPKLTESRSVLIFGKDSDNKEKLVYELDIGSDYWIWTRIMNVNWMFVVDCQVSLAGGYSNDLST